MQEITGEGRFTERKVHKAARQDEDREMEECLARLKTWQTENLMAPHGMDRFAEQKKRTLKMKPVSK